MDEQGHEEIEAGNGIAGEEALLRGDPAEVERLREEVREKDERILRLMADFENLRRRSAERELALRQEALTEAVLLLLPVGDSLSRAVKADGEGLKEGVTLTLQAFAGALERMGIREVPADGQPFDPRRHEALAQEEREDVPEGTVTEVFRPGYTLGERLLRPALVKVAKGPGGDA